MTKTFLELAKKSVEKAKRYKRKGKGKKASIEYGKAASNLAKAAKYTDSSSIRNMYLKRANQYLKASKSTSRNKEKVKKTSPTGKREEENREEEYSEISSTIITEKPDVSWNDIGGLKDAKDRIKEAIVLPIQRPEVFEGVLEPWSGILLFGPPGCGKTMLGKAASSECEATFFSISAADVLSKWLGESEKMIGSLFEKADKDSPSIIFIDEIDSIAPERTSGETGTERRVLTQLLKEMDGMDELEDVLVMGATNTPWILDSALLRRFEKRIHVPLPDKEAREEILKIHLEEGDLSSDVDLTKIAEKTDGYSGSDLERLCREASMIPLREGEKTDKLMDPDFNLRPLKMQDFEKALEGVSPIVTEDHLRRYVKWEQEHGSG